MKNAADTKIVWNTGRVGDRYQYMYEYTSAKVITLD